MPSGDHTLTFAHVGFTSSDADRERLLAMNLWLDCNDPDMSAQLRAARARGRLYSEFYDLNMDPPRDFLVDRARADVVVLHNLWGGVSTMRATASTTVSPHHSPLAWARRLRTTLARHIFVFGGDFSVMPEGYARIDEPELDFLAVWTRAPPRFGTPIGTRDLAEARMRKLADLKENQFLDLGHIATITPEHLGIIAQMRALRTLILAGIPSTDAEIASMLATGCSALETLYLDGTQAGEATLHALPPRARLETLSLNDSSVGVAGLQALRLLPRLRQLSLINTRVGDDAIDHLSALQDLRTLSLVGARLSSGGIARLTRALPNCDLAA